MAEGAKPFAGKHAWVTGSSRGIGRGIAAHRGPRNAHGDCHALRLLTPSRADASATQCRAVPNPFLPQSSGIRRRTDVAA